MSDHDDLFLDTGGLYALLVKNDAWHGRAVKALRRLRRTRARIVTTDYVLDEAATLLVARGVARQARALFDLLDTSDRLTVEWIGADRFSAARAYFLRHADHGYSFTDCTSFVVMKELRLSRALTADRHFQQAGFIPIPAGR